MIGASSRTKERGVLGWNMENLRIGTLMHLEGVSWDSATIGISELRSFHLVKFFSCPALPLMALL